MLILAFILVALCSLSFYIYIQQKFQFWKKLGIPYLKPTFFIGNVHETFKMMHFAFVSDNLYKQTKKLGDYVGTYFFTSPMLYINTPEMAKTILVRDFNHFTDRGLYFNKEADPLSGNIFFVDGDYWRILRQKISPTFTSGKIKAMFHTIAYVCDELVNFVNLSIESGENELELKDVLARFTTDIIGKCGFGVEINCLLNPNEEFRQIGKKIFQYSKVQNLKSLFAMLCKKQAGWLKIRFQDEDLTTYLQDFVRATIAIRREKNIRKTDFMQLMIDLYKDDDTDGSTGLTINEIAAQSFLMFFAGFETSSTTITFCLYEMALNPHLQDRLRNEVQKKFDSLNGKFTYDSINEMPYLDQVISETLRIYPPIASLHRAVSKEYRLPNGAVLPNGTFVTIPNYGFHHDPEYFPNPEKFDPERFNELNKPNIRPYSYLPFSEGNRNCVGLRFGLVQTKMGIATLIKNYKISVCQQTQIPLLIDPNSLIFVPNGKVYLKFERCF